MVSSGCSIYEKKKTGRKLASQKLMKRVLPLFQELDYKNIRSYGKSPGSPQRSRGTIWP